MQKRTLTVLAIAAFAGAALPFGLPNSAAAAPLVSYDKIVMSPLPIAQPGTLVGSQSVTMCVQPQLGGQKVDPGQTVWLSIDAGLFTNPHVSGGSAIADGMTLSTTPQMFITQASCTFQGGGIAMNSVPVTYTAPASIPAAGRDVIVAADTSADSGSAGVCPASPAICDTGTYVYSPVADYTFSQGNGNPIAPPGLAASTTVTFTVAAIDSTGQPVPGAFLDLSLSSSGAFLGTATALSSINNPTGAYKNLNNAPNRFGADNSGLVSVKYTTPATLPSVGVDTITAQNHPSQTFQRSSSYTYGAVSAGVPGPYTAVTPFRICDTRPAGPGVNANQCDGAGQGAIGQGATRVVQATGITGSNVPGGGIVTAVVVNLTAIGPTKNTFISLFPAGGSLPRTSNVNPLAGSTVASLVEVGVNGSGQLAVFNDLGSANIALDVEGYVSPTTSTGLYTPLAQPVRVCDTRAIGGGVISNQCDSSGPRPIAGGTSLQFNVHTATDNVPTGTVTAVVLNLTAILPSQNTVLTAYPSTDVTAPTASNVNLLARTTVPNRVIVQVPADGVVDIRNSVGSVNVAVDIDGYFTAGSGAQFTSLTPARVCDTRSANTLVGGCFKGVIGSGQTLNIYIPGIYGIPVDGLAGVPAPSPVAAVLNITAVTPSTASFVSVFPGPFTGTHPNASDLNLAAGKTVTNLVVVTIGSDGTINLFNDLGNVNLIVDVLGYYS
jgi:hypothetical protein